MTALPLGLFGFALMAGYWPGISGAATLPRWWVLAALSLSLLWIGRIRITEVHAVGMLFCAWAALSLAWSAAWHDSIDALLKLAILAAVFAVGSSLRDLRPVYIGAALGLGASAMFMAGGLWGGLFVNPLFMAEAAVLVAAALLAPTGWAAISTWPAVGLAACLLPAIALPAVTTGRGPLVALSCCGLLVLAHRRPRWAVLGWAVLVMAATGSIMLRPGSVVARLDMWQAAIEAMVPWGHGFGAFGTLPPQGLVQFDYAHNALIQIGYELGVPGAALAIFFFVYLLPGPLTAERLVLIAFIVEAAFAFPDRLPATAGLALLAAGRLAADLPYGIGALDRGRGRLFAGDGVERSAAVAGPADCGGRMVSLSVPVPLGAGATVGQDGGSIGGPAVGGRAIGAARGPG